MVNIEDNNENEVQLKYKGGGSLIDKPPIFSPDDLYLYIPVRNTLQPYNIANGAILKKYQVCEENIIGAHVRRDKKVVFCSSKGEITKFNWNTKYLEFCKVNRKIDKVHFFHVLFDGDIEIILLIWSHENNTHVGLFSFKDFCLKALVPFRLSKKKKPLSVGVGGQPGSQFMAILYKKKVFCCSFNKPDKIIKYTPANGKEFTCLSCHPIEYTMAIGNSSGQVIVFRGLFSQKEAARSIFHWHTLPVNTIAFSGSGSEMFTGGNECVVVRWQLNNPQQKNFLPRLPAPIVHLVTSPQNKSIAISLGNNAIHLVDSRFSQISVMQQLTWGEPFNAGLHIDMRTKALVLNGSIGNLQFYSPYSLSLLYELEVVGQNKLTQERNLNIPNTNVTKVALSKTGEWLACVEERMDGNIYHEIRLKFFHFVSENQTFSLNTSVEFPHENGVNAIAFQPASDPTDLLCATTGNDNRFKIWSLVDTTTIYRESRAWRCVSTASYKNLPAKTLSFSLDGSLLAVAFGPCLTCWSPDTCQMKCSLVHSSIKESLNFVHFGNLDQCHLVVTASDNRLCVWNLLTLGLEWTVKVRVTNLCKDFLSTYMAVFTDDQSVFVFSPNSSSFMFHKRNLCKNDEKILGAVFVPNNSPRTVSRLNWQRMSQLHFITSNKELFCFDDTQPEETTHAAPVEGQKTPFCSLLATTTLYHVKKPTINHMDEGLSGGMKLKELIEPAVHTMAPMKLLCSSVLRSLIVKRSDLKPEKTKNKENDEEDEKEDEKEDEDFKSLNGALENSGTDSESDSEPRQQKSDSSKSRRRSNSKSKEERHKNTKKSFKSVLSETVKWTSILVD